MAFEQANSVDASLDGGASLGTPAKPPPWWFLIVMDLYCAELASGLFTTAVLGDLIAANGYRTIIRIGYLTSFPIAFIDLLCLVFDLGDPIRFHHMMRVFKLRSPMSLGTWAVSAFSLVSFTCFVLAVINLPGLQRPRAIIGGVGLPAALFVAGYKGVMLSCTAQPIWKRARWLGAELQTSSALMGVAALLLVALLIPASPAIPGLRRAQLVMLCLNLIFVLMFCFTAFPDLARKPGRRELITLISLMLIGSILPIVLTLLGAFPGLIGSACLVLGAGLVYRHELVMYPHRFG